MNEQKTLLDYLKRKQMTLGEFSDLTKISYPQIQRLAKNPDLNINVNTAKKIYHATEKKFGVGLGIWEYLRM